MCFIVSHTVHDLVFIWNLTDPLVVNPEIELPQLDISNNYTSDCTIEYSTGKIVIASLYLFSFISDHQFRSAVNMTLLIRHLYNVIKKIIKTLVVKTQ